MNDRVDRAFRAFYPNIRSLAEYFEQARKSPVVRMIGNEFFQADGDAVFAITRQFKENLERLLDPQTKDEAKEDLRESLRTWTQTILAHLEEVHRSDPTKRFACVAQKKKTAILKILKERIVEGSISLARDGAKNGDIVYIKIEARQANGKEGVGLVAEFEGRLRYFKSRVAVSPSLMFVKRLGVSPSETTIPVTGGMVTSRGPAQPAPDPMLMRPAPTPIDKVNFAPFPGATFGVTFFGRGLELAEDKTEDGQTRLFRPTSSAWSRFLQTFSPGVGVNLTFMNFNDPKFDISSNRFTTTSGSNVQIGAGVVGSLFNNKLQFSYGWNLNVDSRRRYFGIGFDFIKVGQEFAKFLPKSE